MASEEGSASAPATTSPSAEDGAIKAPPAQQIEETDEFGLVAAANREPDGSFTVQIDRVDMLGGAEAEAAAASRGDEVSNDYYLVNDNPRLRSYVVPADAVVWGSIRLTGQPDIERVPFADWAAFVATDDAADTLFTWTLKMASWWQSRSSTGLEREQVAGGNHRNVTSLYLLRGLSSVPNFVSRSSVTSGSLRSPGTSHGSRAGGLLSP